MESAGDYYYWVSKRGREIQSSFDGWPFDDEGAIKKTWQPLRIGAPR